MSMQNNGIRLIGHVTSGTIDRISVRLHVSPKSVREGTFLKIKDGEDEYLGLLTDFELNATNPKYTEGFGLGQTPDHIAKLIKGQIFSSNIIFHPSLSLYGNKVYPIRNIPEHLAPVYIASAEDIRAVFGDPSDPANFVIGTTREDKHPVCLNLDKLVQRSSGVFGASGTGKSFTVRMILAGLIHYDQASILVLDMHNEYGLDDIASDTGERVTGLKTKFPAKVRVVSVGAGTTIRGNTPDFNLEIPSSDITTGDIELLTEELGLKETTSTTLAALYTEFGQSWFKAFRMMKVGAVIPEDPTKPNSRMIPAPDSVAAWANKAGVNSIAAEGLHSKMERVFHRPYVNHKPAVNGISEVIKMLEDGKHVVLSFGDNDSDLDYMLVSNILTRRIRQAWECKTNAYRNKSTNKTGAPRPLTIVVEEAHKLLCPALANQTTFGTIAREMRKYFVTLMIIDQRPSQISSEVLSQIGTRVSSWLGDDDDIQSTLAGLPGKEALRGMLSRLRPKEEALLMGWGVSMSMPVKTRRYDSRFWKELLGNIPITSGMSATGSTPISPDTSGTPSQEVDNTDEPKPSTDKLLKGLGW